MVLFEEDKIQFLDEEENEIVETLGTWKILIVDDERIVHESTKMVLNDFVFQEKKLLFLSAYNAVEAEKILVEHDDIAVILLDVVMEKEDSGLKLVKYIRDELKNTFIRIILRTGQPGQAPEEEVVVNYDINDYKMKTELTLQKLLTTVVSALRSYSNIMELEINRKGLEDILKIESELNELHDLKKFADHLLKKAKSLYKLTEDSLFLRVYQDSHNHKHIRVISGSGKYAPYVSKMLPQDLFEELKPLINEVSNSNGCHFSNEEYMSAYKSIDIIENFIYFNGMNALDSNQRNLFKVLVTNLSVAVDNLALNEKLIQTQSELINRLSEVIEVRSEETASHVSRVSRIAYLIAKYMGMDEEEAQLLKMVAPLHDVGKIGIPEAILNKPARLTDEEFEVIKEHAMIGYRILKGSGLDLLEAGALVAKEHHEYWNGKGYPLGLKGEEIHIYGRITIIADVFDALSHDRIYKKAWPFDEVIQFINDKSGEMFDPDLVNILNSHKSEIKKMYDISSGE